MGANAQTAVPAFTAGQVLTAAQQTQINTGIPVFATTTTRDAAFGGTGEKTLAEGQYAYLEDTNTTQYYDGSAWQTVGGGLTLIKTQTIGTAVSTVAVTGAFSATYDNYLITINGGAASGAADMTLQLGATTTNYYSGLLYANWSNTALASASTGNANFGRAGYATTTSLMLTCDVQSPFLSEQTQMFSKISQPGFAGFGFALLDNTTSYTDFTIGASGSTMTGGTIRVYGYQNS